MKRKSGRAIIFVDNKILLINNQEIASKGNKIYELYIWISETGKDQSDMMNKTFSGKITVVGHQKKQSELLSKVIKNNNPLQINDPNFNKVAVAQDYYDILTESTNPKQSEATVENGLYAGEDADGETYYFRGNVEDNYLKIEGLKWPSDSKPAYLLSKANIIFFSIGSVETNCDNNYSTYGYISNEECKADIMEVGAQPGEDMLFRITRINGDGTIRIIADGSVANYPFNQNHNLEKYVGYTYDNSKPNIQNGNPSNIKRYLDNWYKKNMTDYDKILASTRYCNDTSVYNINGNSIYYGAYNRIRKTITPTYICPNTNKTYGGEYDLKIGLLSADEIVFAGGNYGLSNKSYYLYGSIAYKWLMSPYYYSGSNTSEFGTHIGGNIDYNYNYNNEAVVPVLNIRADTPFTQGDGTKDNPYLVRTEN